MNRHEVISIRFQLFIQLDGNAARPKPWKDRKQTDL